MRRTVSIICAGLLVLLVAGCPPRDGSGKGGKAVPAPVEIDWPDSGVESAPEPGPEPSGKRIDAGSAR